MKSNLLRFWLLPLLLNGLLLAQALAADPSPDAGALTFFGWSDQHVQTDGSAEHLVTAIDAMNAIPGTPYPESIGGVVAVPAFVFGCGDITEWPTHAAMKAYDQLITKRLKFSSCDILGNHDEGGKSPSETMTKWLVSRHGSLSTRCSYSSATLIARVSILRRAVGHPVDLWHLRMPEGYPHNSWSSRASRNTSACACDQ